MILIGSYFLEDLSLEEKNESNKNEVEKFCKLIMNGIDNILLNNMIESNKKNFVLNDLDISVLKVQFLEFFDFLEKILVQEILNFKIFTDSVIIRYVREEINRDSVIIRYVRVYQSEGKFFLIFVFWGNEI